MQAVSFATNRSPQMRIEYLPAVAAVVALGLTNVKITQLAQQLGVAL